MERLGGGARLRVGSRRPRLTTGRLMAQVAFAAGVVALSAAAYRAGTGLDQLRYVATIAPVSFFYILLYPILRPEIPAGARDFAFTGMVLALLHLAWAFGL